MIKNLGYLMLLSILLVACSSEKETTEEVETDPVEEQEEESHEPAPEEQEETEMEQGPEYVYPLTGLEAEEEATNRIVAVMVNNHPKARPQTGLSQADLVFEILAEGNITRLMAMYQSEMPDKVGPVRSARPYYFNLADDYNALYIYHGAAEFIDDMLINGAADFLNGAIYDNDKVLFERSADRVAPHNSYVLFDSVYPKAEGKGYDIDMEYEEMNFTQDAEVEGDDATNVQFSYGSNSIQYQYQEASEQYIRFDGGTRTTELETGEDVTIDNIFILETYHQVVDSAGRREIDLSSGGDALLLQKGKVQHVQWERNNGRIIPTKDGEPVPFVPGKTWVNVIPTSPGVSGVSITGPTE
ncbi:DUF3048 domain-containing protein [Gracilibacillus sp. YIM 98692]|uniref:DUF3048 domain-containing protein n=1 Tax=Gracilibacillus sp. YIM 98692 TaxID=2663532 RepID=UPI0013D6CA7F|nr:DUF3048 domain-containing protein [Gracilibacillus sp. YIM 98692]